MADALKEIALRVATDDARCLDSFKSNVDYALQKDRNGPCAPGTGQWLFHHPEYDSFQEAKSAQLLIVTAEAGGGKSTAMRTLIDRIREFDGPPLVAYFFFKDDDDDLRSYGEAMNALIYQILEQEPALMKYAQPLVQRDGATPRDKTRAVWKLLRELISRSLRRVYCVLDAADECAPLGREQMMTDLLYVFEGATSPPDRLKVIVSSRPFREQTDSVTKLLSSSKARHLSGEKAHVMSDIRKVIEFKAHELAEKRQLGPEMRRTLNEKIWERNIGTRSFLAIHMAFEILSSESRLASEADGQTIDSILADVPEELSDQYDGMLRNSLDAAHARNIFSVVLAARRNLKISDLKVIYAMTRPGNRAESYEEIDILSDDEEFKRLVRSRCGPFIIFVKNSVRLFHQTAREYLLATDGGVNALDGSRWKGSISKIDANLVCATVCLDIITFAVSPTWLYETFDELNAANQLTDRLASFASTRPFFEYAALNWHQHVVLGRDRAGQLLEDVRYKDILDISKVSFWVWCLPVIDYRCTTSGRPRSVISDIWAAKELDKSHPYDHGMFLRNSCLGKAFRMGAKVYTLLGHPDGNESPLRAPLEPDVVWGTTDQPLLGRKGTNSPSWRADEGYHFIDAFHVAYGEEEYTSASQAVQSMERGDVQRAQMLSVGVDTSIMAWMSIVNVAPKALYAVLASAPDMSWVSNVPEHLLHPRRKWSGSCTRTGADLKKERQNEKPASWPPGFPIISRASSSPGRDALFGVLADQIEACESPIDNAQRFWEMGGFLTPSFCCRLLDAGAAIDSEIWAERATALHIAARFWKHDAIHTLLELGADPDKRTPRGDNALHWFLYPAEPPEEGNEYPPRTSMSRQPQKPQPHRRKSLIAASIRALTRTCLDRKAVLAVPDSKGGVPLILAIKTSSTATRTLLEEGVDADSRDDRGRTALMHFFRGRFTGRPISSLKYLLESGADSRASDLSGRSVLGYWMHKVTDVSLSDLRPGSNSYNKAFGLLSSVGPLSRRNVLVQELTTLNMPLVVAAQLGNARLCWALLDAGSEPDDHGIEEESPLRQNNGSEASDLEDLLWNPTMIALRSKAYTTAAILLQYGAKVDFKIPQRKRTKFNKYNAKKAGLTPLHVAISAKSGCWLGLSISLNSGWYSKGCELNAVANIDYKVAKRPALESLKQREKKFQKMMRERRSREKESDSEYEYNRAVSVNDGTGAEKVPFDNLSGLPFDPKMQRDPLLEAVITRLDNISARQEALVEYMLCGGAAVDSRTDEGITPLLVSVHGGRLSLTKLLLKHGANPNLAAKGGCTALMVACSQGRKDLVEVLLAAGANCNVQLSVPSPSKCNCKRFVSWGCHTHTHCQVPLTALVAATERGDCEIVELLLAHGADVNLEIIHHAHGRLQSKRERVTSETGRSPDGTDDEEEDDEKGEKWQGFISTATALTWARDEVRELLLRHGADPGKEVATRECDCVVIEKRVSSGLYDSDDEYPAIVSDDSDTPLPWRNNMRFRSRRDTSEDSR